MIIEQKMPSLSPTMEEGTIVSWQVKPGDEVEQGDSVAEIQTDKAVVEWEVLEGGHVREILIDEGQSAKVNMVAAIFSTDPDEDLGDAVEKAKKVNAEMAEGDEDDEGESEDGEDSAEESEEEEGGKKKGAKKKGEKKSKKKRRGEQKKSAEDRERAAGRQRSGGKRRVSPVAARMAAEYGVPLDALEGSGTDGRIVRRDVEEAIAQGIKGGGGGSGRPREQKLALFRDDGSDEHLPISPMRATIGKRLLESKTTIPHFYVTERVNVAALMELRRQANAVEGIKITVNDLIVRACALALRAHPAVNATFDGGTITRHDSADVSVAVAIPEGLITPIVFGAHELSLGEISETVRELAERAQGGGLKPEEYQGGTFTVSNLGMYGIEDFAAIINPPQAAIVAVSGIKDEAVVEGDRCVPGKVMRLTLSADHRVVDGADAADFLRTLRRILEIPAALLL